MKILEHCLGSAASSPSSNSELLHHSAALTGDLAWAAVVEAFVNHQWRQMRGKEKVCQTGRHSWHSDVVEKRRMMAGL